MREVVTVLAAPLAAYCFGIHLIDFYRKRGAVKTNYRGVETAPALGPALLLSYLVAAAAALWLGGEPFVWISWTMVLLGFSLLGLWDDLFEDDTSGFRGHFGAGWRGGLTAGLLKVVTAGLVALIFTATLEQPLPRQALAFFVILLSANGINLMDRRPGRALKVFFISGALFIFLARPPAAAAQLLLPLMAAALAAAYFDLSAEGMLGDCGANLLGAALGITAVLFLPLSAQLILLAAWAGVHLLSEKISLSNLIEESSLLRYLDGLGRSREKLP